MVQNLEGMGFTVVPFGQGFKDMSPPTKELVKLTLEEKIAHGGHPVLRWMMDNIYIRTDPQAISRPTRKNPQKRLTARWRPSWGLTGQSAAGTSPERTFTTIVEFSSFDKNPMNCNHLIAFEIRIGYNINVKRNLMLRRNPLWQIH